MYCTGAIFGFLLSPIGQDEQSYLRYVEERVELSNLALFSLII